MARESHDREDLLRDATAFKSRVQLQVRRGGKDITVFAGFRSTGAVSIYFDQDPVYHFNSSGQLRRAYVSDRILKAEKGQLIALIRQRNESETSMLRQEMNSVEQTDLCLNVQKQLSELSQAISSSKYCVDAQISSDGQEEVVQRLASFLNNVKNIEIAASPHVGH